MSDVVIAGAKRTAIGSFLGQFAGVPTPTLGRRRSARRWSTRACWRRTGRSDHGLRAAGESRPGPRRQAALAAGVPTSAGCTTINKVCGSGMKAIMLAHDLIRAGSTGIVVAGGMESMSNAPHLIPNSRTGTRYGNFEAVDHTAWDGPTNPATARRWACSASSVPTSTRSRASSRMPLPPNRFGAPQAAIALAPSRRKSLP